MRGTGYAIVEIIWWLLVAAIIGFVVGWILKKWFPSARLNSECENNLDCERRKVQLLDFKLRNQSEAIAALRGDLSEANNKWERFNGELLSKSNELEDVNRRMVEQSAKFDAQAAASTGLQSSLDEHADKIVELKATVTEQDARIAGLRSSLDRRDARINELEVAASGRDAQIGKLEAIINDKDEQISALDKREDTIAADQSVDRQRDRETAIEQVSQIAARSRSTDARVYDDLKKIHGIGPKLEQLLRSMDITSFQQVARFTPEDVALVTVALDAFPGRIERDGWISSAAAEYLEKYGESLAKHQQSVSRSITEPMES